MRILWLFGLVWMWIILAFQTNAQCSVKVVYSDDSTTLDSTPVFIYEYNTNKVIYVTLTDSQGTFQLPVEVIKSPVQLTDLYLRTQRE
ncbi:MAG: hypothetical protein GXO48_01095 [Chlorobi bacterium]|nr:hypothetical protein [Chlorobiota bacterium]